jgi:site-specific DNA-methyltransferase (cytosine-N4-specific)
MTSLRNIAFKVDKEDTSYLTHSLHPYPAKFPPQLPQRILAEFSSKGDLVLDPFCGSGTTLVEARLLGVNSVGVDINALSCLLSKVKATPLSEAQLNRFSRIADSIADVSFHWGMGSKQRVEIPVIEGLEHWFQPNVVEELAWLKDIIYRVEDSDVRDLLKIVFASIIVQVSNQESDTRYAAIEKNIIDNFTLRLFLSKCSEFENKMKAFSDKANQENAYVKVYNADTRSLEFLSDNTFDIVITSPPYANTYDYYLYHKFRKRWLDLDVQYAQYNEIGSRREFSSLKKDPSVWVEDLKRCFAEIRRVLKVGGNAFIVIGDSVIKKNLIQMDEVISNFASEVGFRVCDVISVNLSEHSRMFNPRFTQKGKKEHLILMQKTG